jgi:branched-chain amino acid aminotransferase
MIAPTVWVNGTQQPANGLHVAARDRGLTLADGLFETMFVRNGTVFRLGQHLERLEAGLATLEIPVPATLRQSLVDAVKAAGTGEATARLIVTRGPGSAGLAPPPDVRPTVIVAVVPLPVFPPETYAVGLTAHVASGRRNERAMTAGLKTMAYADSVAALLEARRHGADEALFLDTQGRCSEATASNLFAWIDGVLITPSVSCGALPGITRAAVLELAGALGIPAAEREFGLDALRSAGEAFLTSSLRGIAPLVRVDSGVIGSGRPGEVTRRLLDAYTALVASEIGS